MRTPTRLGRSLHTLSRAVVLAFAIGLCGGYLDLVGITFKKYCCNELRYFWSGSDFPWSVPVVHASLLSAVGIVVGVADAIRPGGPSSTRGLARVFAALAIWSALLRMPLYGVASLLLAAGLARTVGELAVIGCRRPRRVLAGLLGLLAILAAASSSRPILRAILAARVVPSASAGRLNVILIVWDTVRSPSLSLHGYRRDTTPRLREWAKRGVTHALALAPAPWTYPSHSSFFTGHWPYQLDSQWNESLDSAFPTLAEFLSARGYQTAAFVANTRGCSYETGLDRGFDTYRDYPLTARFLLGRTVPGSWILANLLGRGDYYAAKWIEVQSRDARAINEEFLGWMRGRRRDRPFFAFLNYYDAHSPYVPPPEFVGRFGTPPRMPEDYRLLFDFTQLAAGKDRRRNFLMARDCYDACVASLDHQVGRLLDALRQDRVLDDTIVIITSDHGESFGDHGEFGHGGALYLDQTAVPLVILAPGAPAGRTVTTPVSLRDLPATVVDRLGLADDSPFPGRSLAGFWDAAAGVAKPTATPAFSELAMARAFRDGPIGPAGHGGLQMSLLASGWHYIRDARGIEHLHDLRNDPSELDDRAQSPGTAAILADFRRELLAILTREPGTTAVERLYLRWVRDALDSVIRPVTGPAGTAGPPGVSRTSHESISSTSSSDAPR